MDEFLSTGSQINFIPCLKWIKRGVAKANPEKVKLSKNELLEVIRDTRTQLRGAADNAAHSGGQSSTQDEFNFDNYDADENMETTLGIDSYAELQGNMEDNFSESDDSDKEDEIIKPADNLIVVGHVEGDASTLEIYLYNEEEESLYVHHDILLPAFPLCFEWLDFEPNAPKGNYCAVGSMSPLIQIWDLDVINCIEPAFTLGKKASVKKRRDRVGHSDAVLALAWNKKFEHILASGSVDQTVLLWDLESKTPSVTIEAFADKVQCLEWHRMEGQTLLAGGADKTARVFDCTRTPTSHQTWSLDGEAERLAWNPLQPFMFLAGTSTGSLQCFDCRKGQLWSVKAHEQEVTGLVISDKCPGLAVTASPDGLVKTWDCNENEAVVVHENNFNLGTVQCLDLSPDSPFVIAAGGDNKAHNFKVFDLRNVDTVMHKFKTRELVNLVPSEGTASSSDI